MHLTFRSVSGSAGQESSPLPPDPAPPADRPRIRTVYLRPARFFACSALNLLHRARLPARKGGGSVTLVCTDRWHLRVLHLAGLSEERPPTATLRDALTVHGTARRRTAILSSIITPTCPAHRHQKYAVQSWGRTLQAALTAHPLHPLPAVLKPQRRLRLPA
ncbi:hypothetical protein ACFRFL_39825 [Streptomyces sp. NPDC056708]|uniref:hypothetical protein n=1 Tax=unclassified Streptomyces TaxID=2593676 RepID=UPI0036810BBB